jgi:DNA end-binding protein Ku
MYLVMIRPAEKGLVMQQLLYADEVRTFDDVPMPDAPNVREAELKLAQQLVDQISSDTFEPTKYEDEVKTRVLADIQRKVDGQEIEAAPEEGAPAQVIDLMEALKASLEASGGSRGGKTAKAAPSPADRRPAQRAVGSDEDGSGGESEAATPTRRKSERARKR